MRKLARRLQKKLMKDFSTGESKRCGCKCWRTLRLRVEDVCTDYRFVDSVVDFGFSAMEDEWRGVAVRALPLP